MSSSWNISGLGIINVVNDIDRCHTSTREKNISGHGWSQFPFHSPLLKLTMWWFELAQIKYGLQNEHDIGSSSIDAELCNGHLLASFLRIPKLYRDTKTNVNIIEQKVIQGVVVGQTSSNNIVNKWQTVRFWNASGTWERTVYKPVEMENLPHQRSEPILDIPLHWSVDRDHYTIIMLIPI